MIVSFVARWIEVSNAWVRSVRGWRAGLLAATAGALSALAMAPYYLIAVLGLTLPLCAWLMDGAQGTSRPVRAAAWRGWAFGFGYFLAGLYWVGYSFLVNPDAHLWLLPIAAPLLPGGLALFIAAAFAVADRFWRPGWNRIVLLALCLSASEYLRGVLFTGFPWNLFGYAWGFSDYAPQIASVIGIYGLSLMTILAAMAPAMLVRGDGALEPLRRWVPMALMVPVLLYAFGWMRLPAGPQPNIADLSIRLVQPNVPQAEKWRPELVERNWRRLIEPLGAPGPAYTHAIWPEAAPPFRVAEQADARRVIAQALPRGAILLTGSVYREDTAGQVKFFNAMHALSDTGDIIGTYQKSHLVPFGEYLPAAWILESLGITKITGGAGGFTSGPGVRSVTVHSNNVRNTTFGPLICYEVVFPAAVVQPGKRPDWLVNLTDDSWFGPSTGPYQHLGIARMRAIEEGLSIVRAANTGMSAIIDPFGRVVQSLPLNEIGTLAGGVPMALPETLYAKWGNVIYALAMAALAAWLGWGPRPRTLAYWFGLRKSRD